MTIHHCLWLAEVVEEHPYAVAGELIRHGLRLRDVGQAHFSYHDFFSLVISSDPTGHFYKTVVAGMTPEEATWGTAEHHLATLIDYAALQMWSKSEDAQKGRKSSMPKPIDRPGRKRGVGGDKQTDKKYEGEAFSLAELKKRGL